MSETGGEAANMIAIILCSIGLLMLLWECYLKDIAKRNIETVRQRDME
ncbi:hypothetical protein PAECIP111893_05265 [Paenibacillus plantiphilus]|uniref:Uncharacterized protein n=1 Tax=Paenibacillus plantiphilus TaxID=2905650 RepID=A0ABM9CXE0_9BACL|nr:hypothetical protein [Paenibacillus plantiphilus]CAH1225503.1 hypothetical protein PAECIP111893_05265 [Paenibacillus plantiphilus]